MSLKRLSVLAMLLAAAIVLSIVESFIPVFVPGVKLGLANVIILIMLYEFKVSEAFCVELLRIVLTGLLRGTLLSPTFFMSLSGGVLSFFIMLIFSRVRLFSVIGVSVLGSVGHCGGQILAAIWIMSADAVVYYLPFIAVLSVMTGIISGIITRLYLRRSITKLFLKNKE